MNEILQYGGVDWAAMVITFVAIYLLGNKRREGFACMIAANLFWVVFGVLAKSYAMIVANIGFAVMNVRGYMKWSREDTSFDHHTSGEAHKDSARQ